MLVHSTGSRLQQIASVPSERGSEGLEDEAAAPQWVLWWKGLVLLVVLQFGGYDIPDGCVCSDPCRLRWAGLSSFTGLALAVKLFCWCKT